MGIWKAFFNNTRKPEGLLGKCMVGSMNHAHAALADWGLSHLPETGPARIAELGCGGGRNIRALLRKYPATTITALDYSEIAVEKAKSVNREGLQAGRCQILQESLVPNFTMITSGLNNFKSLYASVFK